MRFVFSIFVLALFFNKAISQCALTVGFDLPNISCVGDSLVFSNTSSNATTYSWEVDGTIVSNASDLVYVFNNAATHSVRLIAADTSCADTISQNIVISPKAQLLLNGNAATCYQANDGVATVIATGGSSPYTYQWSNNRSGNINTSLTVGVYTITVVDNNSCTVVDSIEIIEPDPIIVSVSIDDLILCGGSASGGATATVTNGIGRISYQWSSGEDSSSATMLEGGAQEIVVTDFNGCIGRDSFVMNEPPEITYTATVSDVNIADVCNGQIVLNATGGTGNLNLSWSTGANDNTLDSLCEGAYVITLTDAIGCTKIDTILVDRNVVPVRRTEAERTHSLKVYPNPIEEHHSTLFVDGFSQIMHYKLLNHLGQTILEGKTNGYRLATLDMRTLESGSYWIVFTDIPTGKQLGRCIPIVKL